MAVIVWIEDQFQYINDIIDTFVDQGRQLQLIENANAVINRLDQICSEADVVILDLWLPLGDGGRVPPMTDSERGQWLYDQIREKLPDEKPIVILSGNLDIDTILTFQDKGLDSKFLKKKPVEFNEFVDFINHLIS